VFVLRSHAAGSLRDRDAGRQVTLAGWVARRRDHGGVIFIDLRDASGLAQVVFRAPDVLAQAHRLRAEFCVLVSGFVEIRPEGNANAEIPTGEIEVNATSLTVLGESAALPFQLDEPAGEELRLKYRYLDLRRDGPAAAIRRRSKVNAAARGVLARHDFVEVETPTITRSTPDGARDFLVPARLHPGSFYALPQSPQLFKQLLMVAGMERYYQIARCYRDEDFRADRQPEFTQLDMEMSFVEAEDVIAISEEILTALWALIGYRLPTPIPRISYAESMRRFGSDKPDMRFGLELVECTEFFSDTTFRVFQAPYVGAVVMPGGASQPRRTLDGCRSGPSSVGTGDWPTCWSPRTERWAVRWPRTSATQSATGSPRTWAPGRGIASSSRRVRRSRRGRFWARPAGRSRTGWASSIPTPGRSSGWWTRRCSSPLRRQPPPATWRSAPGRGPRCITPSPPRSPSTRTPWALQTPIPAPCWPTLTTSSATATKSAAAPSVSTAATSRSGCSR